MSRDLQNGDAVRVAFERLRAPSGATRIGTIVAAGIERGGTEIQAIRYEPRGESPGRARPEYYDAQGRSLRAAFLRAPLEFRRISSGFGLRLHPILGEWKNHTGTDYAAAAGTPVRAIGDGVVLFAGVRGGYGNSIDVRHANGFVSRYGHMRAFARGVRTGSHVAMGSTIGYVGMTGLATAPHLHFEIRVAGVARDPRSALKANAGTPLPRRSRRGSPRQHTPPPGCLTVRPGPCRPRWPLADGLDGRSTPVAVRVPRFPGAPRTLFRCFPGSSPPCSARRSPCCSTASAAAHPPAGRSHCGRSH